MSGKPKPELRREKRIVSNVPVTAKKRANGASEEIKGTTRDVNRRGVFMYMSTRVDVGSELELVFPMPQSDEITDDIWVHCRARVLRVEESETGNRFGVAAEIESYEPLLEDTKYRT